jgi:putative membrane protein
MVHLAEILPHANAALNGLAGLLLVVGYVAIRQRRETAHKWIMLSAFAVSVVFLASYLTRVALGGLHKFPEYPPPAVRVAYLVLLASHVILAAAVPFLAVATIALGVLDRRAAHRRLAWITFPVWLYVSITGVLVYLALYQLYPPRETSSIMPGESGLWGCA